MTDKIIQFATLAYQDPSADVRFWGKKIILLLSQHYQVRFNVQYNIVIICYIGLTETLQI